jgi:hypothetical protein
MAPDSRSRPTPQQGDSQNLNQHQDNSLGHELSPDGTGDTTRPFATAALHLKAAGWAPIPILGGGKGATPGGVTGYHGIDLEGEQLQQWIRRYGDCVVATRAPIGDGFWTIGIDCDHYGDKTGGETLAKWEAEYGPLPPTYVSTSRDAGRMARHLQVPERRAGPALAPSGRHAPEPA